MREVTDVLRRVHIAGYLIFKRLPCHYQKNTKRLLTTHFSARVKFAKISLPKKIIWLFTHFIKMEYYAISLPRYALH